MAASRPAQPLRPLAALRISGPLAPRRGRSVCLQLLELQDSLEVRSDGAAPLPLLLGEV